MDTLEEAPRVIRAVVAEKEVAATRRVIRVRVLEKEAAMAVAARAIKAVDMAPNLVRNLMTDILVEKVESFIPKTDLVAVAPGATKAAAVAMEEVKDIRDHTLALERAHMMDTLEAVPRDTRAVAAEAER